MFDLNGKNCFIKYGFQEFDQIDFVLCKLSKNNDKRIAFGKRIKDNLGKVRNYFNSLENLLNPITIQSHIDYKIFSEKNNHIYHKIKSNKVETIRSEDSLTEIDKPLDLDFGKKYKDSRIFLSWKKDKEGFEKIEAGIDVGNSVYYSAIIYGERDQELDLGDYRLISKDIENEVNDFFLDLLTCSGK